MKTWVSVHFAVYSTFACLILFQNLSLLAQESNSDKIKVRNFITNNPDVPWPDLGEPMIIEPEGSQSLDEIILNDVYPDGTRKHHHYILRRGETYHYELRIENDFPLMITAEEGDGPLPVIQPIAPLAGEAEAPRAIHALSHVYIKNIHFIGRDKGGSPTDNATIRLRGENITCVILNSLFDFNRRSSLRVDGNNASVHVENSLFYNSSMNQYIQAGNIILLRDLKIKHLFLRNNTFVNATRSFIHTEWFVHTEKMIISHNTFVNSGISALKLGKPDTFIFKNNLVVNPGILGEGWDGQDNNKLANLYMFDVDSLFEPQYSFTDAQVNFSSNHVYVNPVIPRVLPDTSNSPLNIMLDEDLRKILKKPLQIG
jgi:hypothetical protein